MHRQRPRRKGSSPKVFDPFYTTKPVGKGTGLGLSICYGIVTEHGGEISVRNVPPRGACFTIQLPGSSVGGPAPRRESRFRGNTTGQGRILLIDSEDAVLDIEREFLRPRYPSVYAIRTALEAVRLLEAEEFDLIVIEWKANGVFAGQEFYDWIRTVPSGTRQSGDFHAFGNHLDGRCLPRPSKGMFLPAKTVPQR